MRKEELQVDVEKYKCSLCNTYLYIRGQFHQAAVIRRDAVIIESGHL
jgi:hypothetical protein